MTEQPLKAWLTYYDYGDDEWDYVEVVYAVTAEEAKARSTAHAMANGDAEPVRVVREPKFDYLIESGNQPTEHQLLAAGYGATCEECWDAVTNEDFTPADQPKDRVLCEFCAIRLFPESATEVPA